VADAVEPAGESLDLDCGDPAAWHATSALSARTRTASPIPARTKARWSEVSVRISRRVDTSLRWQDPRTGRPSRSSSRRR
jgi:hypothetical protein